MDFPFDDAKKKIDDLINSYQNAAGLLDECPIDTAKGRMYELVVLSHLIDHLVGRGFRFRFVGKVLELKEKPGVIKASDPYFEGTHRRSGHIIRVYTDVQVMGLGCLNCGATDLSAHHEIDLVVVGPNVTGRPTPFQLLLGVECKSGGFGKAIIKEALGVKREISLLQPASRSKLSYMTDDYVDVPSEPEVEFWLAHFDPKGQSYKSGPEFFGIDVRHYPV